MNVCRVGKGALLRAVPTSRRRLSAPNGGHGTRVRVCITVRVYSRVPLPTLQMRVQRSPRSKEILNPLPLSFTAEHCDERTPTIDASKELPARLHLFQQAPLGDGLPGP